MDVLAGPFLAAAALLAVSGILKVRHPAPTVAAVGQLGIPATPVVARGLGVAEVIVGIGAPATGGRGFAFLVSGFYVGFAVFVVVALVRKVPVADCGCFGAAETPPTGVHLTLNLAAAGVALAVALRSPESLATVLAGQPLWGLPFLLLIGASVGLAYAAMTVLPRTLAALNGE